MKLEGKYLVDDINLDLQNNQSFFYNTHTGPINNQDYLSYIQNGFFSI